MWSSLIYYMFLWRATAEKSKYINKCMEKCIIKYIKMNKWVHICIYSFLYLTIYAFIYVSTFMYVFSYVFIYFCIYSSLWLEVFLTGFSRIGCPGKPNRRNHFWSDLCSINQRWQSFSHIQVADVSWSSVGLTFKD